MLLIKNTFSSLHANSRRLIGKRVLQKFCTLPANEIVTDQRVDEFKEYRNYVTVNIDWKVIEDLMPPKTVPRYDQKSYYPSGWTPPDLQKGKNWGYHVSRTKNHMLPVYLGMVKLTQEKYTVVRNIDGDLMSFSKELLHYLEGKYGMRINIQVNEICQKVLLKEDFVNDIKDWLTEKGF